MQEDNISIPDYDSTVLSPEVTDALNNINPEQRAIIIHYIHQTQLKQSFTGPLPHPDILQGYENVQDGFAERIFKMAEEQQAHRIKCEDKIVRSTAAQSVRGQWFGFLIAILCLAASVALGFYNHEVLAGVIGGTTIISLVAVFITNKYTSPNSDKSKTNSDHD